MNQQSSAPGSAWFANPKALAYRIVLIAMPLLLSLAAILAIPFSRPMPAYWSDATELATTGHVTQHFEPAGYAAFLAAGIKLDPGRPGSGVEMLQTLLAVATVLIAWALMRHLGASPLASLAGAALVAFHPELVVTVTKVWDVTLSTALLLLLVWLSVRVLQDGLRLIPVLLLAMALGASLLDRPNFVLLLVPIVFAFWQSRRGRSGACVSAFRSGAVLMSVAVVVYAVISLAVYGSLVLPGNGPYNLYAGQNQFSERALLDHLNAEPALGLAMRADPTAPALGVYSAALKPYFVHAAIAFAKHNPGQEFKLVAVKLYTLLRADTKLHRITSPPGFIKLLLTLPIPLWLVAMVWFRRSGGRFTASDTLVWLTAIVYLVPFLITNSDPRFRTPLDILALTHAFALWSRGRAALEAAGTNPKGSFFAA